MRGPAFTSPRHDGRAAALLGLALGIAFTTCFLTGLVSHLAYDQPSWWPLGPRPAGLYRLTQGVHVAAGIASVPLLLVKLWVVYPHFWTRPPVRSVTHAVERSSLLPLVGGSLFLLLSGVGNLARWRPWGFFFTDGHYHAAWITIGGLVVHIGAKAAITAGVLRGDGIDDPATAPESTGMTRRQLLGAAGAASVVLTVATVGQTLRPLAAVSLLGPRDPRVGPQGVPINKTAHDARLQDALEAPDFLATYRLEVVRGDESLGSFTLDDLRALPATVATLPITCVEGWSANATWRGVAVRDLLREVRDDDVGSATVVSMEHHGRYRTSELQRTWLRDRDTLLAYELDGDALDVDHGWPLRLIAPNRPGVLQTKWVERLELA
jgi:DMSO/TMAO reductase YedYZ molybdopterin-dependent catalytic subunit